MSELQALLGLFTSSFLASTLLPGGSEAVLGYLALERAAPTGWLLLVATLGNTLGGMSSWLLGWWLDRRFPDTPLHKPQHQLALKRIRRHGGPVLLLSWLPVVGDPLCLAAGWSGIRALPALLYIGLGKAARYALLLYLLPVTT